MKRSNRMTDRILILDFGSQVTQLIARRVRESGVYCEIQPYTMARRQDPRLRARRASSSRAARPRSPRRRRRARPTSCSRLGVPVLAICYGMQTMCAQLGGRVTLSDNQEFGRAMIDIVDDCALFAGLWPKGARAQVWMSHGDRVDAIPAGFRVVAATDSAPYAAIADDARRFYGVPVPPRGRPHAAGRRAPQEFHPPHLRLPRRLDDGGVSRPGGAAHPRPGRRAGGSFAASRAASIPRSPRRSSTRRSASASPASSSIPACCARARPRRSCACSAAITTSR